MSNEPKATMFNLIPGDTIRAKATRIDNEDDTRSIYAGLEYRVLAYYPNRHKVKLVGNAGLFDASKFEIVDVYKDIAVHVQERIEAAQPTAFAPAALTRLAQDMMVGKVDPSGKPLHEAGAKADLGKPRMGLVLGGFAGALIEVARVGTFGANKYSDNGWMSVPNGFARYEDAQMRHAFSRHAGEDFDQDSKLSHLAHEAWNALAKLQLALNAGALDIAGE